MEPPISDPVAIVDEPVASATPEPPEDPPGEKFLFQGFKVTPCKSDQVVPNKQNSGVVVLPIITLPASFNLAVTGASSFHSWLGLIVLEPLSVGHPFVYNKSLIAAGTPSIGLFWDPFFHLASESLACWRALSSSIKTYAFTLSSISLILSIIELVTSTGDKTLFSYALDNSEADNL